ncbi:hypothetical protein CK203_043361 [Vitis vinifera]|uniref:Uncharacterized protein n=1 Tax=Vitis vinifera TaxID=29760 RepID=A0A438IAV7_VITVI|nr:hypothetical protein CK203_043361 [Vitis vinifera]
MLRGLIGDPRGKFKPNWSGPYVIQELTPEGAAWLTDLDGNQFLEPTNMDQLKNSSLTLPLFVIELVGSRDYPTHHILHMRSDDVWQNLSMKIVFNWRYQSHFFDTPDAYTGAYYPHHGIFLVVIGLYDSHIHDLYICLTGNDRPLSYATHLLWYTLA